MPQSYPHLRLTKLGVIHLLTPVSRWFRAARREEGLIPEPEKALRRRDVGAGNSDCMGAVGAKAEWVGQAWHLLDPPCTLCQRIPGGVSPSR